MHAGTLLSSLYATYANWPSLAGTLHEQASVGRFSKKLQAESLLTERAAPKRDQRYVHHSSSVVAAGAARCVAYAFKPIDALVGTGRRTGGVVTLHNGAEAWRYVRRTAAHLTDTGVAGLAIGAYFALPTAAGALLGVVAGLLAHPARMAWAAARGHHMPAVRNTVGHAASLGACVGLGAALGQFGTASLLLTLGMARLATGVAKAALAGAAYGVGYGLGAVITGLQVGFAPSARSKLQPWEPLGPCTELPCQIVVNP